MLTKKNAIFLIIILLLGSTAIFLALDGQKTNPGPDWAFHLCYSRNFNAQNCAQGYQNYAPTLHLIENAFQRAGFNEGLFLAGLMGAMVILTTYLLWKAGGELAVFTYFIAIPAFLIYIAQKAPYLWFNMALYGLVPFVTSATLAFLLLIYWETLKKWKYPVIIAVCVTWNYGVALAGLVLTSVILSKYVKNDEAKYWVFVVSGIALGWGSQILGLPAFFSDAATRFVVLFYLALSVIAGRWLTRQIRKPKTL